MWDPSSAEEAQSVGPRKITRAEERKDLLYSPHDASPFPLWYNEVKETKLPYTDDP